MDCYTYEYHVLSKLKAELELLSKEKNRFIVGAIILNRRGQIISLGVNSYNKTHPAMLKYNTTARNRIYLHAEVDALIKCRGKEPYTMIVSRLGRKGDLRLACPCPICRNAILDSKLHKVYYSNNNGMLELMNLN